MNIGILGTGMVGQALATKFKELGHEVSMGSRTSDNENALEWAGKNGGGSGTFNDVASRSDVLFNCTNGSVSLEALALIDSNNLEGKILVDVANELKYENGKLESLASATNSLGKKIQDAYPQVKVVKSFNTLNAHIMVNPSLVPGDHNVFLSGNDLTAKQTVSELFQEIGWKSDNIIDLGGIETAVGPEMFMGFWITLFTSGKLGDSGMFNVSILKQ